MVVLMTGMAETGRDSDSGRCAPGEKLCRICQEPIRVAARACPHCGSWQLGSMSWQIVPLFVLIAALIAVLAVLVWRLERFNRQSGLGHSDARYAGEIRVASSRMLRGESKDGPTVFVVGIIENASDVSWGDIKIEARFLDAEGKLIDTEVEDFAFWRIQPRGEMAFKVRTLAQLPAEQYVSHQVRVQSAERAVW
jgi:hypothetical protein